MKIGIDWKEKSTIRGTIWLCFSIVATVLVFLGNSEGALTVMTIAGIVAGGIGVGVKDNANEE